MMTETHAVVKNPRGDGMGNVGSSKASAVSSAAEPSAAEASALELNVAQPNHNPSPLSAAASGAEPSAAASGAEPSAAVSGAEPSAAVSGAEPSAVESGAADPTAAELARSLTITSTAADYARQKLAARGTPGSAIRLGIKGGGCSGFGYVIEFSDDPPRERDRLLEVEGVRFYVDKKSMIYLAGSMLDYERTLMFQGFKFRNPQEASSCGCGHSFTVR